MLTVEKVRNAPIKERPYKLFDERGLYLLVTNSGSKLWRYKYRFEGREKTLAFGPYPEVRLSLARDKRDDARRLLLAESIDPAAQRKAEKIARLAA